MAAVPARSRDPRPDPAAVAAWLRESCERAGVPVQVTDPAVLRGIGVLLGTGPAGAPRQAKRAAGRPAQSLEAPDGVDPSGVEASAADLGRVYEHVVDDGTDDGRLAAEREGAPSGP